MIIGICEVKWPELPSKINKLKKLSKSEEELWQSTIKLSDTTEWQIQGEVVKGFGRGSKLLMVPTGIFL